MYKIQCNPSSPWRNGYENILYSEINFINIHCNCYHNIAYYNLYIIWFGIITYVNKYDITRYN